MGANVRMSVLRNRLLRSVLSFVIANIALSLTGCSRSLPKGAVGNIGTYNYSPTIIQSGNTLQVWWCGQGVNPLNPSQDTDAIYYSSADATSLDFSHPVIALSENPGTWDSAFICNPKAIGGVFTNPLGDGQTYNLALYYVATSFGDGSNNSIGVAFSNDGIHLHKYPHPVIQSSLPGGYGVGQPSLYNADHKSAVTLVYEDSNPSNHHVAAVSTDGIHFTVQGTVTAKGLDPDNPDATWGDMALDSNTGEWYALFNRPIRPAATTGGVIERGQYGVELYKIRQESLITGNSPWKQLATIDTNTNGFECNFIAGFVHDTYGNLNLPFYPAIKMYASVAYPQPSWQASPAEAGTAAAIQSWILMPMEWMPNANDQLALNRYFNGNVHEVTTGWIDGSAGFQLDKQLGHLYSHPENGATLAVYGCKNGDSDYFLSLDVNCEGQRALGKNGYAYEQPVPGVGMVPLYRCSTATDHFASSDPKCEGQTTERMLGYILP
jgi:hypothetical protein